MNHRRLLVLALLVLIPGAAAIAAQGALPGDVAITRALQGALGSAPAWAGPMTDMAKAPWLWASMVAAVVLAGLAGGRLRAASPLLAYGFAWGVDQVLRMLIFVPRPDAALVAVASASSSSGLPSTFGLVFGALFGAAFWIRGSGVRHQAVLALSALFMAVGAAARIVLGGHWLSQMVPSFALGILLAGLAVWLIGRLPYPSRSKG